MTDDFKKFDISNVTPEFLEYIIDNGYIRVNELLTDHYPIYHVIWKPDLVKVVISRGANVNVQYNISLNQTPLHDAAQRHGSDGVKVVKMLLDHHAEINAVDKCGRTPLFYAHDPAIKQLLIENGAILKGK